jgi:isoleucyl-tRNA synthetase
MLGKDDEGMMADEQRATLRQMLLRLRKRTKEYRHRLSALDVEIKQNANIAQFFFNSAKAKYVSPDLKMTQRTAARRFERSAAVAKKEKARVQQQMQGHLDLCKQVTGVLAAMKT